MSARCFLCSLLLLLAAISAIAVPAKEIPAGTRLELRLKTKVASNASKASDPVEAVVISPVILGDQIAIAQGTLVKGIVKQAQGIDAAHPRASLALEFNGLVFKDGAKIPIATQLLEIDNARETLDESGQITGILASDTLSSRMDSALQSLNNRFSSIASILRGAKNSMIKEANPEIEYAPGVEFSLKLTKAIPESPGWMSLGSYIEPIQPEPELIEMAIGQPFQTVAQKPPKPSDVTNLMFLGARGDVEHAFEQAGWSAASALSAKAKMETLRAIVEDRGYSEAPVSILLLDGQPPDLVFEKMNNTFASRHHLRVWKRPGTFHGREIWVCAATHDIAIEFSPESRTFIHKIDSQIDRERAKVVFDLIFTGLAKGLSLVERPAVPRENSNATGDKLITDGKIAVLLF